MRRLGVALVAGLLAALLAVQAQAATRELRYADFGPDRGPRAEALRWFDQELRRRSGGALGLKFIWGGALLGARNAIEGVGSGVADLGTVVAVYEPGKLVALEAVDVFQVADEWVGLRAVHDFLARDETAQAEFRARNLRFLAPFTTGPTQLIASRPVRRVADLRGLTVRATGNFLAAFAAAGATAVAMPQPEVYQALSSGAIDASATYDYVVRAYRLHEVAGHLTELNLGQSLGWGMAMNRRTWDSLAPGQRALFAELADDFVEHLARTMRATRDAVRAELTAGGDVSVVTAEPELRATLVAAAEAEGRKWLDKAAARGWPGEAMLESLRQRLEHYRAQREQR